jgi:hypothetical protein
MMRSVYRDRTFAIGTGNFCWVPGGDYADHDTDGFNIVWSSPDRFNYIGCYHPYWYSDGDLPERTPDTWWHGNISPFQQTAHNKRTVITLFDIPEQDPWPNKPSPEKWAWRDGHAARLIRRGMVRYPKSADEEVEADGWIFLREGKTYVGIRPLKDYYIRRDLKGKSVDGFNIIQSDFAQTGFIFETGSEETHGSFEQFRNRLQRNRITVRWEQRTVTYTDSGKETLSIRYVPGLSVATVPEELRPDYWSAMGITGLAESVPLVTVNGKQQVHYRQWPMIESPMINMNGSLLKIDDGQTVITVDWTGPCPVIRRSESATAHTR